jgi:hypothetical protein
MKSRYSFWNEKNPLPAKKEVVEAKYIYPADIKFSDFEGLIAVDTTNHKNKTYLYFNSKFIKDYALINDTDLVLFQNCLKAPKFCGAHGESGIKYIAHKKPHCDVTINGKLLVAEISAELKVLSESRIILFALNSLNGGPTILVASHFLKKGFHHDRATSKSYQTKDLIIGNKEAAESKNQFKM